MGMRVEREKREMVREGGWKGSMEIWAVGGVIFAADSSDSDNRVKRENGGLRSERHCALRCELLLMIVTVAHFLVRSSSASISLRATSA
jgi:hypothetical protein